MNKILTLLVVVFVSGCGSHYYHNEANSYVSGIKEILVENHVCSDKEACKSVYADGDVWRVAGSIFGGVNIDVYGVGDSKVIGKILSICAENHSKHPSVKAAIRVYSKPRDDNNNPLVADLVLLAVEK